MTARVFLNCSLTYVGDLFSLFGVFWCQRDLHCSRRGTAVADTSLQSHDTDTTHNHESRVPILYACVVVCVCCYLCGVGDVMCVLRVCVLFVSQCWLDSVSQCANRVEWHSAGTGTERETHGGERRGNNTGEGGDLRLLSLWDGV